MSPGKVLNLLEMIPCSVSISSMLFLGTFHKMKKEGEEITAHGFVKQRFFSL